MSNKPAWHDPALDFHGPTDFAEFCEASGAHATIDPKTGKVTVVTGIGHTKLPPGPLYSYTEKRQAMHNLQAIGIVFVIALIFVVMFAIPLLIR